jgi:hypothetical protein
MLTANLKFRNKKIFFFFAIFYIKNRITNDSYSRSQYLRLPFAEKKTYVPIKHKQMSFVSNGGKFKLYTVLNGLLLSTATQRI